MPRLPASPACVRQGKIRSAPVCHAVTPNHSRLMRPTFLKRVGDGGVDLHSPCARSKETASLHPVLTPSEKRGDKGLGGAVLNVTVLVMFVFGVFVWKKIATVRLMSVCEQPQINEVDRPFVCPLNSENAAAAATAAAAAATSAAAAAAAGFPGYFGEIANHWNSFAS